MKPETFRQQASNKDLIFNIDLILKTPKRKVTLGWWKQKTTPGEAL